MADSPVNDNGASSSDILGQLNPNFSNTESLNLLRQIANNTQIMSGWNLSGFSQANARTSASNFFRNSQNNSGGRNRSQGGGANGGGRGANGSSRGANPQGFLDRLEEELIGNFLGSEFREGINSLRSRFMNDIGGNFSDFGQDLGQELGRRISESLNNSQLFNNIRINIQEGGQNLVNLDLLRQIANNTQIMSGWDLSGLSQANRRTRTSDLFRDSQNNRDSNDRSSGERGGRGTNPQDFLDRFEEELMNNFLGSEFRNGMNELRSRFMEDIGGDFGNLGQEFGRRVSESLNNSQMFNNIKTKVQGAGQSLINGITRAYNAGFAADVGGTGSNVSRAFSGLVNVIRTGGAQLGTAVTRIPALLTSVGPAIASFGAALAPVVAGVVAAVTPLLPIIAAGVVLFLVLKKRLGEMINNFKELGTAIKGMSDSLKKAGNRDEETRKKMIEEGKKRLSAVVDEMIKAPFEILKKSAEEVYQVWDTNLRKINGTQGYDKEDLSDLMGAYADRIREEGLSRVVGATDITSNLAKVLDAGLSGQVAEEFAYLATKLSAAVPTQDFFSFASEYAAVAASQIQLGKSESSAISYANSQLEAFASNLLYAGRELAGGFSTGLKDASSLFSQSVRIANASESGNVGQVSGVLTSVAAIMGAVAPDLASSFMSTMEKALTGGNSSDIIALRSLAGINASNSEFLRQFTEDPQGVFTNLFSRLGEMQNMAPSASMEVAEGLASIFGVSMDALTRVDFNYLASAVRDMQTNSNSLSENIKLLKSGETTTNAEQLRMEQINKYLIDEGLAYVMDNETARAIQQHMWDEQMALELTEATYGVEIQGAALDVLEAIRKIIDNILNFLNPLKGLSKLINAVGSAQEGAALKADVGSLLKAGAVGSNISTLSDMTTYGKNLNLTDSIVSMYGGYSQYESARSSRKFTSALLSGNLLNPFSAANAMNVYNPRGTSSGAALIDEVQNIFRSNRAPSSKYNWDTAGGGRSSLIPPPSGSSGASVGLSALGLPQANTSQSVTPQTTTPQSNPRLQEMLKNVGQFTAASTYDASTGRYSNSYEDWVATARSQYGIADFKAAYEAEGHTADSLRAIFEESQTQVAARSKLKREADEESFWKGTLDKLDINNTFLQSLLDKATSIFDKIEQFHNDWVSYFIDHTVYDSRYDVNKVFGEVRQAEQVNQYAPIFALADQMLQNTEAMRDPTYQTNALLSAILGVVNAIMQQNDEGMTSTTFADTLKGAALGYTQ